MNYSHRLLVANIIDSIEDKDYGVDARSAVNFLITNQEDIQALMDKFYRCTATNEYLIDVPDYYDLSDVNKDLLFQCLVLYVPDELKENLSSMIKLVYDVIVKHMEGVKRHNSFFINCPYCGERLTYTEVEHNRFLCSNCGKPAHHYAYTGWNAGYTNSKNKHKYRMKHKMPKR